MNRTEAQRLAAAVNQLRPDWPIKSLFTFIETELYSRSYRDAAVAFAYVATDPQTRTPKRLLEAGPWWQATPGQAGPDRISPDQECTTCSRSEQRCAAAQRTFPPDERHEFVSRAQARARAAEVAGVGVVDPVTGEVLTSSDARERARELVRALNPPAEQPAPPAQPPTPVPESATSPQGDS